MDIIGMMTKSKIFIITALIFLFVFIRSTDGKGRCEIIQMLCFQKRFAILSTCIFFISIWFT